jgi:hemolysin III
MEAIDGTRRRVALERSVHTDHAVSAPRPRLRGLAHLAAAVATIALAVEWLPGVAAPARVGASAFAVGVVAMFVFSSLLHVRPWSPAAHEWLLRLDHTGIYLAIVGTGIAIGLLGLRGLAASVLITATVVGGALGIVVEWLPFAAPRGFSNTMYLTIGWLPIVLIPWLWWYAGGLTVALLLAGGALYTVGAVVVGMRRPNPLPRWFGYHELFHVLVIAAVALHATMVARLA